MSSEPRAIGLPAAPRLDSFPSPSVASRLDRPSHLSARVHPLLPSLPFEVSSPHLLVTSRRPVLPGFLPSWRHHARCPLIACALRRPLRSVLRLSQPLDGFLHLHALRACFIPLPRPGFLRSGTSPDPDWASAHRRIHSPMPLVHSRSPCGCHANLPRLRGLPSGPMRCVSQLFKPTPTRFPLRIGPPSGLSPPPCTRFPEPSALDVTFQSSALPKKSLALSVRLQRLAGSNYRSLRLRINLPVRGLWPFESELPTRPRLRPERRAPCLSWV